MNGTILLKRGKVIIEDLDDPNPELYSVSSLLFKAVENYFDEWIESQQSETREMYFGSFEELYGQSYCSKKGAIIDGIEVIFQYMKEEEKYNITSKEFYKIDLDGVFQP